MEDLRIVFMGTPEFAVPSLEILVQHKFNVVAVITAPDKPQGRSSKLIPSPVKECALKNGIPLLQPTNLKAPEFLDELKNYRANLQIVVAFRMLPEVVWAMPKLGTFNLHGSLLPQYRGAAPINWAVINGEKETGVTTFLLKQEIDTGNILFQEKENISPDDDAGSLYDRLKLKGANLVLKTTKTLASGKFKPLPQKETTELKPAPKIFRETCQINWNQRSEQIKNFVRGLSPYPAAWTTFYGRTYKIFKVSAAGYKLLVADAEVAGEIKTDNKTYLYVKALHGWVSIEELQPEGKKRMLIEEFFRGNKLDSGESPTS